MAGMFFRIAGHDEADAVLKIGAIVTLIGVQFFVVNVMRNLRAAGAMASVHTAPVPAMAHVSEAE